MNRPFAAILLIVAVFLCPMHCIGGVGAGDGASGKRCSCSRYCQSRQAADDHRDDAAPNDSDGPCSCANCVCKGAVFSASPVIDFGSPFYCVLSIEDVAAAKFGVGAEFTRNDPPLAGRLLATSFRRLLI